MICDVKNCDRCGQDHDELELNEFDRKPKNHHYYTFCPITQEPLMVQLNFIGFNQPLVSTA